MTDIPPPRPSNEPGDDQQPTGSPTEPVGAAADPETSRLPAGGLPAPGQQYPGPGPDGWTPPTATRGGRIRRLGGRLRGSRVALAIVGVVVAAGLVLGGLALAEGGHDGKGGRDGRGTASQRDNNGNTNNDGNGDAKNNNGNDNAADGNGRGGRDRAGDSRGDGTGRGNNANGNGTGNASGTEQSVLGTITAVSSTSITLRTSGGSPVYPLTATTPVTRNGSAAGVTDLKVGDAVVVHVSTTGGTSVVDRISVG